uniref:Uncharacterized protein n=1 Tax=Arundo donax TaxID=35708 RepID=A0A0A8YZW2_ARUDO
MAFTFMLRLARPSQLTPMRIGQDVLTLVVPRQGSVCTWDII